MGGDNKEVTIGYNYYVGIHMVLCHGPVDALLRIRVDEKEAWGGNRKPGQLFINKPELFGGKNKEGGIYGYLDFLAGGATQAQNDYLAAKINGDVPAYRGVVSMVLRQMGIGMNAYLKPWAFTLSRIHTRQDGIVQWYDAKAEIRTSNGLVKNQSIIFAIDVSTSMDTLIPGGGGKTRLQFMKEQLIAVLNEINNLRHGSNKQVDICIAPWAGTSTRQFWINAQDADFAAMATYLNSLTTLPSTDFDKAMYEIEAWFAQNIDITGDRNDTAIFLTDGFPEPISSATVAATRGASIINRTGAFEYPRDINLFAMNIDLADIQYTQLLDNTASDSVPVINAADSNALYDAIFYSIMGVGSAMNPAHIIRECLTDPTWGMGYQDADIDDTSFMYAADVLASEQMGICIVWDNESTIEEFISLIARHIDATLYVDRKIGKFVLKLIRQDFDVATLVHLNENNILNISEFSKPTFGELTNAVTVTYHDLLIGGPATITVQDIALAQEQRATINAAVSYEGFVDSITATKVAQRDLRILSTPLVKCTLIANRIAENLNIGSAFKFSWPDYEMTEVVMRVTGIAFGDGKNNRIRITCIQDAFAFPENAYIVPPPPQWIDPGQAPQPITRKAAFEIPYLQLVQELGQTAVDALLAPANEPDAGYVGAAAVRPSQSQPEARLYTDSGAGYIDAGSFDFCPGATLDENITQMNTTFAIKDVMDAEGIVIGTWFQIDNELMSVEAITTNSITVKRGVLDTVPVAHTSGKALLFWDNFGESDRIEYVASDVVNVKIASIGGTAQYPLSAITADTVTLSSRAIRPYPPGNYKFNGNYYPVDFTGDLTITWASRNRTQQTGAILIGFTDGNVTPETGTTYKIVVKNLAGSVLHTETGITTLSHVLTTSVLSGFPNDIIIELYSVRDGYESFQGQAHTIKNAGTIFVYNDFIQYTLDALPSDFSYPWGSFDATSKIIAKTPSISGKVFSLVDSSASSERAAVWTGANWLSNDADIYAVCELTVAPTGNNYMSILFRVAGTSASPTAIRVQLRNDINVTWIRIGYVLNNTVKSWSAYFGNIVDRALLGVYAMRLRVKNNVVMAKLWMLPTLDSNPTANEPKFWMYRQDCSEVPTTSKAIGFGESWNCTAQFTSLKISDPKDTDVKDIEFIGHYQSDFTSSGSSAAVVMQIPTTTALNDLIVLCVMRRQTITLPSGWTLVQSQLIVDGGTNQWLEVYTKLATVDEVGGTPVTPKTFTITLDAAGRTNFTLSIFTAKDGSTLGIQNSAKSVPNIASSNSLYTDIPPCSLVCSSNNAVGLACCSFQIATSSTSPTYPYGEIVGTDWLQKGRKTHGNTSQQVRKVVGIKRLNSGEDIATGAVFRKSQYDTVAQQYGLISLIIQKV